MWIQIISGLIGLVAAFVSYLQSKDKIDQAEATIIIENLKKEKERVDMAMDARRAVVTDPDSLHNDKYNRKGK
jgi:archaellum component FlaF (FlaF/FlaG flagellin family)